MKKGENSNSLAAKADRHTLYQIAVQNPKSDIQFMLKMFHQTRQRQPSSLKEDFCGTALLCCEWVKGKPDRSAFGVDLDGPTLAWAREHNIPSIGPAADRLQLIMADCTDTEAPKHVPKVDIACAFNYSVCLFKTRADLLQYLKVARSSLVPDGMFFADLYGGTDAYIPSTFKKHFPDFTYVWETSRFDPITHEAAMAIHFRFPDKSRIKNAFTYGWRLWSIPELVDALHDAGFSSVKIWWAEVDRTGEESYEYLETTHAEQCAMWNCYVVAAP